MKNLTLSKYGRWAAVVASALICFSLGCSKASSSRPAKQDGTSSGGGGFGDENSMDLLNQAKKITANAIRRANPALFTNMPKGWSQERLARLIENIHIEPNKPVYRYNRELMFDYRNPADKEPYLVATSLFFRSHAAIPINTMQGTAIEPYLREVRMRLLHEAAHVLGIGRSEKTDYKARVFAAYLWQNFSRDNVVCSTQDVPKNYLGHVSDKTLKDAAKQYLQQELGAFPSNEDIQTEFDLEKEKNAPYYWFLNRPTSFGLDIFKDAHIDDFSDAGGPLLQNFINGQDDSYAKFAYHPRLKNCTLQSCDGLDREFLAPRCGVYPYPVLMIPQYYPSSVEQEQTISFSGNFTFRGMVTAENSHQCHYTETITIPKGQRGKYSGVVSYSYDCSAGLTNDKGQFPVDCVEGFPNVRTFIPKDFFGDSSFKDPALLQLKEQIEQP